MTRELQREIEESGVQAGWVKLSARDDGLTECETKILWAAAAAGAATNAITGSHTVQGWVVRDQLDIIEGVGYTPERFIWIHAQNEADFDLNLEMARRGAWIEYHAIGSENREDDLFTGRVQRMLDAGLGDHLLLSHDRGSYNPAQPGGGVPRPFTYIGEQFLPKLRAAGVDEATIRQPTRTNPFRAFARQSLMNVAWEQSWEVEMHARDAQARQINIGSVFPHLAVVAEHIPRTETGVGALMPWADRLWFITYPATPGSGEGHGLFSIDENLNLTKRPESVVGTYANRIIHSATNQLIIGPHLIDIGGNVRTVEPLVPHRLTATMTHLEDPENKIYFLTMEALFFEVDLNTLEVELLFDLTEELQLQDVEHLHFKGGYTGHGRVVVANNTYTERDYIDGPTQGRLAEWDGKAWTILETCQFNEVTGGTSAIGNAIFATGADNASAILKVFVNGKWDTYRLPKATHTQDHSWTTEWPRVREVESERWLVNCSGMFYELPAMQYGGKVWGVRPICTHLRIIGDFCSWRGLLVLAGDQTTPIGDSNPFVGQPQANLWFGKTDDLWQFGKPKGWGGPWREQPAEANEPSDPYLMTGFDKKVLHLCHDADQVVHFTVEVDFLGNQTWKTYDVINVPPNGYVHHEFPGGFSAHWVRVVADKACTATAYLHYT